MASRGHHLAFLRQLEAACLAADELAEAVEASFLQHPDAEVILSFRGLGVQLGARVLAEIGDDRQGFADARSLKAYAGSVPITRASGKRHHVGRRVVKNDRLNQGRLPVGLLGLAILARSHCLQTGEPFDEHVAFLSEPATAA
ncbi:hypothetical protein GCM10009577_51570 [Streptomyces javensis]